MKWRAVSHCRASELYLDSNDAHGPAKASSREALITSQHKMTRSGSLLPLHFFARLKRCGRDPRIQLEHQFPARERAQVSIR